MRNRDKKSWIFTTTVTSVVLFVSVIIFLRVEAFDGSGTNVVSPGSVTAGSSGNDLTFTYSATETTSSGEVVLTVPGDWSAPNGSVGTAGYTTVSSTNGTIADVLDTLDTFTGWSGSGARMGLSVDVGDKKEGTGSLQNTVSSSAVANDQWYFNYGTATSWGTAANGTNGQRVGMWLKSNVNTAGGDLSWQSDNTAGLASPEDTLSLASLSADVWRYTSVTFGAARTSQRSYGLRYTTDIGAATVKLDGVSVLFDAADVTTNWGGDSNISVSAVGSGQEGTNAIRCTYAGSAGIGNSGECFRSSTALTTVPGSMVSFWVRSSVALSSGDFAWVDDNNANLGSRSDTVSIPAITANTWTYITLGIPGLGTQSIRSYGLRQVVDKGALTIDIDAMGTIIDYGDVTTGWAAATGDSMTLSSDAVMLHEGAASLKNIIPATALAGDKWFQTLSAAEDWSSYTKTGFWIRSTVATSAGQLKFEYSTSSDLNAPIASINIGALSANTWTYQALTLTGSRSTVNSYGFHYAADIGAATVYVDDILLGPGIPTFPGGNEIHVRLLELAAGQSVVIHYGSGGGLNGAVAPSLVGSYIFDTQSRVDDSGVLASIASSPSVTVNAAATDTFSLNDPGDMTAGNRLAYTVTRRDAFDNLTTAGTQTVYLSSSALSSGSFYDVATGGSPVTSLTIADTTSSADFWYYDDVAGSATVTASDNGSAPDGGAGIDDATDSIGVAAAATGQFLLNDPGNISAGDRAPYTVTRRDSFGNLVTTGAQNVYLFSDSTGSEAFYVAESGGSPVTFISFADASSSADFWYYDDTAGTATVIASDNSSAPDGATGIDDATDSITVSPPTPTSFIIVQPVNATIETATTVTVRVEDALGNLATTYQQDVTLLASGSATGGGLVDIVNGVGTAEIGDVVVETVALTLVDSEGTGLNVSSTKSVNFTAGPTRQYLLNDPGDMIAGQRREYVVTRQDALGNVVTSGDEQVFLYTNADASHAAFYDSLLGASPITSVTVQSGQSTASFWYGADQTGTFTVTVSDQVSAPDGLTGIDDATDSIAIQADATALFSLNDPGASIAGSRLGYIVTRYDQFGNPVTAGEDTVYLSSDSSGNPAFFDAATEGATISLLTIVDGTSTGSFWYYDEALGVSSVTASDNASAPDGTVGINDAVDSVMISAANTAVFTLNDPGDATVGTRVGYTATRQDQFGNAVTSGGETVYLFATPSSVTSAFYSEEVGGGGVSSVAFADGLSEVNFWYTDDVGNAYTITASDNPSGPDGGAGVIDGTDMVTLTTIPIVATRFVIQDPADGVVGENTTVTVRATDDFGSVDTTFNADVTLVLSGSATGGGVVDIINGVGTKIITNNVAETVSLSLSDTSSTGLNGDSTEQIVFAAGNVSQFILNNPGDTDAATRLAYTVTRQDQFGNAVTAESATAYLYSEESVTKFYDAEVGGSQIYSVTFVGGSSAAIFWYSNQLASTDTLTVSDNVSTPDGANGIVDATDGVIVSPASVARFALNDPGDMAISTRLGYTVTRQDQFGNAVTAGESVVYLSSNSTGNPVFYNAATSGSTLTFVTLAAGSSSQSFWFLTDTAGSWTITASDNTPSPNGELGVIDATDVVVVSDTVIGATRFVLVAPGYGTVGVQTTIQIRAEDADGNLDTTWQGDVTLVLSGSATGGGLVNVVNGIGSQNIVDMVDETITLSLSDTENTGLNIQATQQLDFGALDAAPTSGGAAANQPVVVVPNPTVLRFSGLAYPGAEVSLFEHNADVAVQLTQPVVALEDGTFTLDYTGPFAGITSYEVIVTDVQGLATFPQVFTPTIVQDEVTTVTLLAPPTIDLVQGTVLRGLPLVLFGYAAPNSRVALSVDSQDPVQFGRASESGFYKLSLETSLLEYGLHMLQTKQQTTDLLVSSYGELKVATVSHLLSQKTDLNDDDTVNIVDWSIFLFRWSSPDPSIRASLDFNDDGVVNVADVSIFIRSIR